MVWVSVVEPVQEPLRHTWAVAFTFNDLQAVGVSGKFV